MTITINIDVLLSSLVEKVKSTFGDSLVSIILYGSYARGDFDAESDIDVMVILDLPSDEITRYNYEIDKLASRLSLETDICTTVSISLQDNMTFSKYSSFLPFFSNIVSEGVTLYAA